MAPEERQEVSDTKTVSDFDPQMIYQKVLKAGEEWADLKAAYEVFEDNTKSVLGQLATKYLPSTKSRTEAEKVAIASAEYMEHLKSLQDARRLFLQAQVRYDSLRLLAELRRSQESTKRAEMNLR